MDVRMGVWVVSWQDERDSVTVHGVLVGGGPVDGFVEWWVKEAGSGGVAGVIADVWAARSLGRPGKFSWGEGWFPPGSGGRRRDRAMSGRAFGVWVRASWACGDAFLASVSTGDEILPSVPSAVSHLDAAGGSDSVWLSWSLYLPRPQSGEVAAASHGLVEVMAAAAERIGVVAARATMATHVHDNQLFANGFYDRRGDEPFVLGARAVVFVPAWAVEKLGGPEAFEREAPVERVVAVGGVDGGAQGVIAVLRTDFGAIDDAAVAAWRQYLAPVLRLVRPERNYYGCERPIDVLPEDWEPPDP